MILNEVGGDCTLLKKPGQDFYTGSDRNGITSKQYVPKSALFLKMSRHLVSDFNPENTMRGIITDSSDFYRSKGSYSVSYTFADGGELSDTHGRATHV